MKIHAYVATMKDEKLGMYEKHMEANTEQEAKKVAEESFYGTCKRSEHYLQRIFSQRHGRRCSLPNFGR